MVICIVSGDFTVVSAKQIDVYHYHGSWFEYEYELTIEDENGNVKSGAFDTWDNPHIDGGLVGKTISIDKKGYFRIVR